MRQLAPARVPYLDDYLISFRVYSDAYVISYQAHLTLITHALLVPAYREVKSYRNEWFFVFITPLWDFAPE